MISIDPGTANLGWARWSTAGDLVACGASRNAIGPPNVRASTHALRIGSDDIAVLESMTIRGASNSIPPQDLIDVQTVGCLVAAWVAPHVVLLTPSTWKGTVPKVIHHPRIRAALSAPEAQILGAACERAGANAKEVLDAVGIGLYALGRIDNAGVKIK